MRRLGRLACVAAGPRVAAAARWCGATARPIPPPPLSSAAAAPPAAAALPIAGAASQLSAEAAAALLPQLRTLHQPGDTGDPVGTVDPGAALGLADPNLVVSDRGVVVRKEHCHCGDCDFIVPKVNWMDHLRSNRHRFVQTAKTVAVASKGEASLKAPAGVKLPPTHVWCTTCEQEVSLAMKEALRAWRYHTNSYRHVSATKHRAMAAAGVTVDPATGQAVLRRKRPLTVNQAEVDAYRKAAAIASAVPSLTTPRTRVRASHRAKGLWRD